MKNQRKMSFQIRRFDVFSNANRWTSKHEKTFIGAFMTLILTTLAAYMIYDSVMSYKTNQETIQDLDQSYKKSENGPLIFAIS